jgi:hypothetical protein
MAKELIAMGAGAGLRFQRIQKNGTGKLLGGASDLDHWRRAVRVANGEAKLPLFSSLLMTACSGRRKLGGSIHN